MPEGSRVLTSTGEKEDADKTNASVVPSGFGYWGDSVWFRYEGAGEDKGNLYFTKLGQGSFRDFVDRTEVDPDMVIERLQSMENVSDKAKSDAKAFRDRLFGGGDDKEDPNALKDNEVLRGMPDGRTAVFDKNTREFVRWN